LIEAVLLSAAVLVRILANPAGNVFLKQLTASGNHPLLVNFLTYLLLSVFLKYRLFNEQAFRQDLIGSASMIIGSIMIILLKDYKPDAPQDFFQSAVSEKKVNNT
jgi:hypothetical protein